MICDNCDAKIKRKDFFYTITKEKSWIGKALTSTVNNKRFCVHCYYLLIDGKEEGRIKDVEPTKRDLYFAILFSVMFSLLSIKASIDIFTGNILIPGIFLFFATIFFIDAVSTYRKLFMEVIK